MKDKNKTKNKNKIEKINKIKKKTHHGLKLPLKKN